MKQFYAILQLCLLSVLTLWAEPAGQSAVVAQSKEGPLTASLVTCWPGQEIYELYGHSALRIRGEGIDSVWNYGVFDFREPNFVGRFVSGQTDYMVMGYPFAWFLPEYRRRGSRVVEQDLNLTPEEVRDLRRRLQIASLPQNRKYRYNYIKDNCATRITDRLAETTGGVLLLRGDKRYSSYRDEMRYYNRNYPWYQLGIDVALGSGLDMPIGLVNEMFVPVEMKERLDSACWSDGRAVVSTERELLPGRDDSVLPPTPWWAAPFTWSTVVFVLSVILAVLDYRRHRLSRWWYSLWFGLLGLAGCLVAFLVFVSSHEATSPNILLLWLNPLQLIVAAGVWWRRMRPAVLAMVICDIVVMICLLLGWAFQSQSANPAFFPLMAATLVSAGAYAIIDTSYSYNNTPPSAAGHKKTVRKDGKRKRA